METHRRWLVAGHGGTAEVRQPSLAMAGPSERRTSSMVTMRIYLSYLGFGWKHQRGRPRARRCGGESATALSVVFIADEATARHEVITESR